VLSNKDKSGSVMA
jgi:hypothetical protein